MTTKIEDIGISYDRFSSPLQGEGDSEGRQDRAYIAFCERHQLQPAQEQFIDRGLSGFHDTNFKKGDLGRLAGIAKSGAFRTKKGSPSYVLVIEAWDRLGRLRPDKAINRISELLRSGLKIGICRLDDIFTEKDFGTHKWVTLSVFVQLAYEESKQKSERVGASWQTRKKLARETGELATTRLPAWLEHVNGVVRVVPEREAVIKRIFKLSIAGYGHTAIIRTFNDEGVPAFGEHKVNNNRKRSQFSGNWTRPYVRLILDDRRAVGEFQPMKFVEERATEKDEHGKEVEVDRLVRVPDGPPIPNYYPAVISEEEFLLARKSQEDRRVLPVLEGTRQRKYINVFARLLRNAEDGEGFLLHNKGKKNRNGLLLVNHKGNSGRGKTVTFPYPIFERAILTGLREVSAKELAPQTDGPNPADVLDAKLKHAAEQVALFKAELDKGFSADFAQLLRDWRQKHDDIKVEYDRVLIEQTNPLSNEWEKFGNLAEALDNAANPMDLRIRIQTILARAIDTIHLLISKKGADILCWVQVNFRANNVHREYLIRYRTAGFRRQGFWQVDTWRADEWPGSVGAPVDLANPKSVPYMLAQLDTVLANVDVCFRKCERHPVH